MQTNGFGFGIVLVPVVLVFAATAGMPRLAFVLERLAEALR